MALVPQLEPSGLLVQGWQPAEQYWSIQLPGSVVPHWSHPQPIVGRVPMVLANRPTHCSPLLPVA
jgi:hypothetical protein